MLARLRTLALDSLVYGLSGVVSRFLMVWLVPIYTRLFAPEDLGVMGLVTSTVTMLAIFVVLALDNSAARWYWGSDDDDIDRKRSIASGALCQLATALLFATGLYLASDVLAARIVGRADAGLYFRFTAIGLPLSQFAVVVMNWLRMRRRAVATTVFVLTTSVVQIGLTLVFVVGWRWGLRGVYAGQLVAQAVGAVIAIALLRDWIHPRHFDSRRLAEMLRYALPLIPAGLALWVVGFADKYFVKLFSSTAEVGLYDLGNTIASAVVIVTGAFQLAWGPFALSIHKESDAKETYANAFLAYVVVTAVMAAALSLLAPEVIRVFATNRYHDAASVVGFLALGYVMVGLQYVAATGPAIVKTTGPAGVAIAAAAVLNIVLNFLLVPVLGKTGAALATLSSQALTPICLFYYSQRLYPIPYRFGPAAALYGLSLLLIVAGLVIPFEGIAGTMLKLLLLTLFVPVLFFCDIITRERTRALLAAVRS